MPLPQGTPLAAEGGGRAVRNSERMPPTPLPRQAPPRLSHPQRLSPCAPPSARAKDSTQGLAWGQPGQGSCQKSGPCRGLCPAAQHPPLPPRPGWARTKPAPEQPGNEGTPRRDVGAQGSLAPKRPSSGPEVCLDPGPVRDSASGDPHPGRKEEREHSPGRAGGRAASPVGLPENPQVRGRKASVSPQTRGHSWDPQSPACHLFPGPGDPRVEQQLHAGVVEGLGRLDCDEDIVQLQLGGPRAWRAQLGSVWHTLRERA